MTLDFLIAPDFSPERFAGWHMLNTLLQRRSGLKLHWLTPASPPEQAALLAGGNVDLVHANPFDAADLIRHQGYVPFARPSGRFDEMVIATRLQSGLQKLEDIRPGSRIALTDNKDVKLIGLRLLEPADLDESMIEWVAVESFQAADPTVQNEFLHHCVTCHDNLAFMLARRALRLTGAMLPGDWETVSLQLKPPRSRYERGAGWIDRAGSGCPGHAGRQLAARLEVQPGSA